MRRLFRGHGPIARWRDGMSGEPATDRWSQGPANHDLRDISIMYPLFIIVLFQIYFVICAYIYIYACIYIYICCIHIHCINHYITHWMDWAPKSYQKEDQIRIHPGTKHKTRRQSPAPKNAHPEMSCGIMSV